MQKIKTLFLFKSAEKPVKLVKNDNFYSVLVGRKVIASSDYYDDCLYLFRYIVCAIINNVFFIQNCITEFEIDFYKVFKRPFQSHRNNTFQRVSSWSYRV